MKRTPAWKRVIASILDFLTVFVALGYVIASMTGNTTSGGFELSGAPALVLFGAIAAYFAIGRRWAGGTLWDRVLGIPRPLPQ